VRGKADAKRGIFRVLFENPRSAGRDHGLKILASPRIEDVRALRLNALPQPL
jgi:hypothetical protein